MEPLLLFLLALGVTLHLAGRARRNRRSLESWRRVAASRNLRLKSPGSIGRARIEGELLGFPVAVRRLRRTRGRQVLVHTQFSVEYAPVGLGLRLSKERRSFDLERALGAEDLVVGDRDFDDAFVVRGRDESLVRTFLTRPRRVRLLRALERFDELEVGDGRAIGVTHGLEDRASVIDSSLRRLAAVAFEFTREKPEDSPLARILEARAEGDLEAAVTALDEGRDALGPPDPELPQIEAELQLAAGRPERSREALERVEGELDEHDSGSELLASLRERTPAVSAPTAPGAPPVELDSLEPLAPPPPPAPGPARSPEVAAVAERLFADRALGGEIARRFDAEFAGARVRWRGELVRSSRFTSDLVFGREPGRRLRVRVHTLESGYLSHDVHAIVGLSDDRELAARPGETIAFEGRLIRCDAFLRHLFVAEARIR